MCNGYVSSFVPIVQVHVFGSTRVIHGQPLALLLSTSPQSPSLPVQPAPLPPRKCSTPSHQQCSSSTSTNTVHSQSTEADDVRGISCRPQNQGNYVHPRPTGIVFWSSIHVKHCMYMYAHMYPACPCYYFMCHYTACVLVLILCM